MNDVITADDLAVLTCWDPPTICNALEDIAPERFAHGFTPRLLFALDFSLSPVCGFVRTATSRATKPPRESVTEIAAK